MTRDELKAHEWAAIAVEFHAKAEARGIEIPFPDLCFCGSKNYGKGAHKHTVVKFEPFPQGEETTRDWGKRLAAAKADALARSCPVVSKKTHALRVAALGRLIHKEKHDAETESAS